MVGVRPARIGLVLAMALRFIPLVAERADRIREAQAARGGSTRGLRGLRTTVVPLLVQVLQLAHTVERGAGRPRRRRRPPARRRRRAGAPAVAAVTGTLTEIWLTADAAAPMRRVPRRGWWPAAGSRATATRSAAAPGRSTRTWRSRSR